MLKIFLNLKKILPSLVFLFFFQNLNFANSLDGQQKKNNNQIIDNSSKSNNRAFSNSETIILEQIKNQIEELSQKVNKLSTEVEEIKYERSFGENSLDSNKNSLTPKQDPGINFGPENGFSDNEFDILHDDDEGDYQNTSASSISSSVLQQEGLSLSDLAKIENLYMSSIEKFRGNNYEESQILLEKIIGTSWEKSEKNAEIKANSHFLMGEIFYKKPDFERASSNFLKAYQVFSKINKNHIQAGNSLLRLGQTLHASGNKAAACKSFLKLNSDFKNIENSLTEISDHEIRELKCLN
jgi:TolA-binding protein